MIPLSPHFNGKCTTQIGTLQLSCIPGSPISKWHASVAMYNVMNGDATHHTVFSFCDKPTNLTAVVWTLCSIPTGVVRREVGSLGDVPNMYLVTTNHGQE